MPLIDDNAKVDRVAFQTETIASPSPKKSALQRFFIHLGLTLLSVILLTLAYAPMGQFYLAWIGLVPWLMVVHRSSSHLRALLWSWMAGMCFILAKMWWLTPVSFAGLIALAIYCGVYWGLAAWLIRAARLMQWRAIAAVPAIAAIWTAGEFARARMFTGLPWFLIGDTQTPILPICQIADALGLWGVGFWVAGINALAALILMRGATRALLPAAGLVAGMTALFMGYGVWRMGQSAGVLTPGPTVLVIQTNFPQSNKGEKGASDEELLRFHVEKTEQAVARAGPGKIDLAVWSETTLPPMNQQSVTELTQIWPSPFGDSIVQTRDAVKLLAFSQHIGILSGARFWDKFAMIDREGHKFPYPADSRNSAYLFQPDGSFADGIGRRYDKIHLVPLGEYIPFRNSIPILYKLFLYLGPDYYSDYQLQDGSDNGLTVFNLENTGDRPWRFVTPICFEDLDSALCAAMFRPGADGMKRADFMANITNDGWFPGDQNALHLQAAIFRSIENRAPMARSVNTGISGFIDSCGRESNLLPPRVEGTSAATLELDDRITLYTLWGDWFAWLCVIFSAALSAWCITRRYFPGVRT